MKKILFSVVYAVASIFSLHIYANALTLSDIKVQVRRIVVDKANPKIKFTDAEILSYVNEAQRQIVSQTWCLTNRTMQTLVAGTTYYQLPADLLAIEHVEFKDSAGRTRELTETSIRAKQQDSPDYERITGPPMEYVVRDSTYAANYFLDIAYLPIPSTTSALGTVTIDYFNQATDLSASTDVPFDGTREFYPYHYALVYTTTAMMKMAKGDPSAATDTQLAQGYIKLMTDRLGQMPNYNPGFRPAK